MVRLNPRTLVIAAIACTRALSASDQDDSARIAHALSMITSFARDMCVTVAPDSSSKELDFSGEASVRLDGLIAKIADLGVGGSAKYADIATKGVLQKDLSQAYKDSNDCRLRVLDILKDQLLRPETLDPTAMKLSGLWYIKDDKRGLISIAVSGRSFHSTEFTNGKASQSIDGNVQGDVIEGVAYFEPDPSSSIKISERTEMGSVQMRLSADEQRLVGIFTTKPRPPAVPRAVSFEWSRSQ